MPDFPFKQTVFTLPSPFSIRIGNQLMDLSKPKVMGILNLSADSFYSGSRVENLKELIRKAGQLLLDGASILDVGAMSSRPGSGLLDESTEKSVLLPAIQRLRQEFPEAVLSVDAFRYEVVRPVVEAGASMVNDIGGGQSDPRLISFLADNRIPYIVMHSRGTFSHFHDPTSYQNVATEVVSELQQKLAYARERGIPDVIADPGFGFSKNREQNFTLLRQMDLLSMLDCPILVGISRKSMIYKTLGVSAEEALNGTTALHMAALCQGAHILRVHDVPEAIQTITLFETLCSPEL